MALILPLATRARFEKLLRPHVEYLYRLAWRFTGSIPDAEDLVQDVLVKLYPRTRELAAVQELRPWLSRVLYRQFIDLVRSRARSPVVPMPAQAEEVDEDALEAVPAEEGDPLAHLERTELQARIGRALERLNPEQRAVVVMHDVEGYKLEELETILEAPLGTLKSRLHRARERLRELLAMEPFPSAKRVNG